MEEPKINPVFEIIGVYFANCYWNNLYNVALDIFAQENSESLDDAYRIAVNRYNTAFCKKAEKTEKINKHYVDIVKDLHKNYKEYLQTSDTYFGFIDVVVRGLIPENYYKILSSSDDRKNNIFRDVLSKTLTKFTIVLSQTASTVTNSKTRKDKNKSRDQVSSLKDKFIELLNQERTRFCSILMAKNSGVDIRNPDEIPSIPKEVCDKLNQKIKILVEEKEHMKRERNKYAELANKFKEIITRQEETIKRLESIMSANKPQRPRYQAPSAPPVSMKPIPMQEERPDPPALEVLEAQEYPDEEVDEPITFEFDDEPIFAADD
jgi:hypothetical protein